jgi:hypothetical protein
MRQKTKIIFTNVLNISEEYSPKPASSYIPDWYKETKSYINNEKKPNGQGSTTATIKRCMPVFDAINSGYIIPTPCDLWVDQVSIDENEEMGMEEERYDEEGNPDENGMYDAGGNFIGDEGQSMDKAEYDREAEYMNESFLHMQKLAGVITEAQYKTKRKALNEDVINLTYNTDSDDLKYVKNILKKAGVLAKVVAGTFDDEVEITVDKDLRKKAIKALKDNGFDI